MAKRVKATDIRRGIRRAVARVAGLFMLVAVPALPADAASCDDITYYKLVQQWVPTYCIKVRSEICVSHSSQVWSVHGLWPDYGRIAGFPSNCSGRKFSPAALRDILPALNAAWPNVPSEQRDLSGKDRDWFWQHEWYKHGTCAERCDPKLRSQRDYFSLAVELFRKYDLARALSRAGLKPQPADGNVEIETAKVSAAIVAAFGKRPSLQCYDRHGKSYLADIALCVSKQNRELIDCPGGFAIDYLPGAGKCDARLVYPTMPQ